MSEYDNCKYIKREDALDALCYDCMENKAEKPYFCGIPCAEYQRVKNIPAEDVRPVILCRDCIHYEFGGCLKIYDDGAAAKQAWFERKPNDFCSYGERRGAVIEAEE